MKVNNLKKWAIDKSKKSDWKNNRFHQFKKFATQVEFLESQKSFFFAVQSFRKINNIQIYSS